MSIFIGIALAVLILVVVTWMLLVRALREKYAIIWLTIGFATLVLGVFPGLLTWVASILGVALPSNLIFAMAILLLLGVALHLSWELSRAEEEVRRLAEEAAISRAQFDALEARVGGLEARTRSADAEAQHPPRVGE
ncbi:DUF2304 domain-containing protein [uncultured Microbacterium sp.]|uniref:DUF2304 domain-containing protein n=1 Tax=uncultured Microbacterium sp. TaxID=191216 RepID=UPI0025F16FC0|nr:DUF2304 domain-containing protein [uncultured Microbacterium sp.]